MARDLCPLLAGSDVQHAEATEAVVVRPELSSRPQMVDDLSGGTIRAV
jgi:hypothetical protein